MEFPLSTLLLTFLFCWNSYHHVMASPEQSGRVMGYYPSYHAASQSVTQINYSLYTDLLFFVVLPQPGNRIDFDPALTKPQAEKLARSFVAECKKNNVKPHVSIGGWTGSRYFSNFTATASARKAFAKSIVDFTKKYGFVGIDIDWESPNSAGIGCNAYTPQDTVQFGKLLKEIRTMWPEVILSAAISIQGLVGASGGPATSTETSLITQNLNYANLMAYDVYGGWSATTGSIAPLHGACDPAAPGVSVETGFQALLKQGFKPQQILVGIPGYAKRGGKFDDAPGKDACGVQQTWGGSFLSKELVSNKWLSKDQKTGLNGYKRTFDECSGQPFLTNGKYFISYDDEQSSVGKAKFANSHKLAGIFFFDTQGPLDATVKASREALTQKTTPSPPGTCKPK